MILEQEQWYIQNIWYKMLCFKFYYVKSLQRDGHQTKRYQKSSQKLMVQVS